jgi:hypothetical protein
MESWLQEQQRVNALVQEDFVNSGVQVNCSIRRTTLEKDVTDKK